MLDKARLGTRYTCFQCGIKFYDLNRPTPSCPECGADQHDAPVQDIKSLLSKGGGRKRRLPEPEEDEAVKSKPEELEEDEEDEDEDSEDDLDLLGDDDDLE
ncbi:MAG TPA: TIGR02300 family protein [Deltaproteobacteria bacterium]|nr:TIGR02300 family protein [Deltaproteobacteria bacterium]